MKINPAEFVHPEDAEALRQMEAIAGFPPLVKKFMSLGLERLQYGRNLANCIRLSPPVHECGHIVCRHVLYHPLACWLALGMDAAGLLGKVALPVQLAICYWQRRSELSCDRAVSVVTSPETVTRVMARLAGGPLTLTKEIDPREWAKQAGDSSASETLRVPGFCTICGKPLLVGAKFCPNCGEMVSQSRGQGCEIVRR